MSAVTINSSIVTAHAVVSLDPTTEGGMVARANELHRAGIVQKCMELFRIVAQLKKNVLRGRATTWKEYVEKNFTFSLATADNYARIGRGDPTVLTALGAVRHLHQSGRPGHKAAKKTISKEEMATATEAEAIEKPIRELRIIESDSPLMTGAPSKKAMTADEAIEILRAREPDDPFGTISCVLDCRKEIEKCRERLARAERELANAEWTAINAAKEARK